jgi:Type IV secretion system pilin
MIKSIKRILATVVASGALLFPVLAPASVIAAPSIQENLCDGVSLEAGAATGCPTAGDENAGLNAIITLVINVFSVVVGFIAIVMMIYGGFKYITSSGDSGNVTSAKNTIMYALIGLVVVALAQLIVRFVLAKANTVTTGVVASWF